MLDLRTYERNELIEIFNTERIDYIQKKIKGYGYKFDTEGRGKTFKLTITECPPRFREFCIEKLGFAPQTDFKKLKAFLSKLLLDEEFRRLPYVGMAREMAEEQGMCAQTVGKCARYLEQENIIGRGDWIYYAIKNNKDMYCEEITKKQYNKAWKIYFDNMDYAYCDRYGMMCDSVGGHPHKTEEILLNAFESEIIDELIEILEKEKDYDDK